MSRRASYAAAIDWIVYNDDTEWLAAEEEAISVTAALVADLFGRDDDEIRADLKRALKKKEGN
jgi:hypothetical protein